MSGGGNPNHDEHGRFASGDGSATGHADGVLSGLGAMKAGELAYSRLELRQRPGDSAIKAFAAGVARGAAVEARHAKALDAKDRMMSGRTWSWRHGNR